MLLRSRTPINGEECEDGLNEKKGSNDEENRNDLQGKNGVN